MKLSAEEFCKHTWALSIGVGAYTSGDFVPLLSPERNASRFAAALIDPNGCAVPDEQVQRIPGEHALKAPVLSAIRQMATALTDLDFLLLYFSGHGVVTADDFYLCMVDATLTTLADSAISGSELEAALRESAAYGILVIVDCCHSGSLAEHAPGLFLKSTTTEFRLMISSSGGDQSSWEVAQDQDTIFSRHLIRVVGGLENPRTSAPGQIRLSELLAHLRARIEEDFQQLYPGLPRQTALLIGVQSVDPLVLAHRGLTFKRIAITTVQYSREYLHRLLLRAALGITLSVIFLLGTLYTIADHTQYVRREGDVIVLYRGHPKWLLPGYPQKLWSIEVPPAAAKDGSPLQHESGFIVAPLGQDVQPMLLATLKPEFDAMLHYNMGQDDAAYRDLNEFYAQIDVRQYWELGIAAGILAELAHPSDIPLLKQLTSSNRQEVRTAAFRGLVRISAPDAVPLLEALPGQEYRDLHVEVLHSVQGACSPPLRDYLSWVLRTESLNFVQPHAIDAVLRLKCRVSLETLDAASLISPYLERADNVAMLAALVDSTGFERLLLMRLKESPNTTPDWSQLTRSLLALAALPAARCPADTVWPFLQSKEMYVRWSTVAALLRHCDGIGPRLVPVVVRSPYVLSELLRYGVIEPQEGFATLGSKKRPDEIAKVLEGLTSFPRARPDEKVAKELRPLLGNSESLVREKALEALAKWSTTVDEAVTYMTDNTAEVQRAAFNWWHANSTKGSLTWLFQQFGNPLIIDFPEYPFASDLADGRSWGIEDHLRAGQQERERAAALLAMYGTVAQASELLFSTDLPDRTAAADYVANRADFPDFVAHLSAPKSALMGPRQLLIQLDKKKSAEAEINEYPDWARSWRRDLLLDTVGQRAYSKGLRLSLRHLPLPPTR